MTGKNKISDKETLENCKKKIDNIIEELYDMSKLFYDKKITVINLRYVIDKLCEYSFRMKKRLENIDMDSINGN